MRIYTSHFRPSWKAGVRLPVMVSDALSWRVLIFGWLGLVLHGAWLPGLLAGSVALVLHGLIASRWLLACVWLSMHLMLALFTGDILRWDLRLRGFSNGPIIAGHDRDAALLRLLDHRAAQDTPKAS